MIPRGKHARAETIVEIPDDATHVRIEVARHHANDRTLWPHKNHFATCSAEQFDGEFQDGELLGSGTGHGNSAFHEGVEQETSWVELPLRTWRVDIMFKEPGEPDDSCVPRVFYMASEADIKNHTDKWERERGITPSKVTRITGRKVQVTLVAHTRPVDTHVTVTPFTLP